MRFMRKRTKHYGDPFDGVIVSLQSFFEVMHTWEVKAYKDLQEAGSELEKSKLVFKQANNDVDLIYAQFLTSRDRKYTLRHNNLGSPPEYDPKKEYITNVKQINTKRIEIQTAQTQRSRKHKYVFALIAGEWKLDNKQRFGGINENWKPTTI